MNAQRPIGCLEVQRQREVFPREGLDVWWFVGRSLIYGTPILAGLITLSYIAFMERYAPIGLFPSYGIMFGINAVLGAIGSAVGVILLTGRTGVRVAGAIAYAVLSLFLYAGTCGLIVFLFP